MAYFIQVGEEGLNLDYVVAYTVLQVENGVPKQITVRMIGDHEGFDFRDADAVFFQRTIEAYQRERAKAIRA